jgi:hypothetical protein
MNDYIDIILEGLDESDWDPGAELLAKGFPIYYRQKNTPKGNVLKEYPDGKIELVAVDTQGNQTLVKVMNSGC